MVLVVFLWAEEYFKGRGVQPHEVNTQYVYGKYIFDNKKKTGVIHSQLFHRETRAIDI